MIHIQVFQHNMLGYFYILTQYDVVFLLITYG